MRRGALANAVAVVLLASGCTAASSTFSERADAICGSAAHAIRALPAPRTLAQAASVFKRDVGLARQELSALAALVPSRAQHQEFNRLLAAIRKQVVAAERLRLAGLIGDTESAQGAYIVGQRATRAARLSSSALGLRVCGR